MDKDLYRESRPIDVYPTKKDAMATYLRSSGYTLRAVAKILGYDSTDEAYKAIMNYLRFLSKRNKGLPPLRLRVGRWYTR